MGENDQKMIYTEKSARPNVLKILFWILVGDFGCCLLYGIGIGSGGSIDAQMEHAPPFLVLLTVVSAILAVVFYRMEGKRKTSITVYEHTVVFSAPKIPVQEEDGVSQEPANSAPPSDSVQAADSPSETDSEPPALVNPYLRKNRRKPAESSPSPAKSPKSPKSAEQARNSEKKFGKVTYDTPNSEIECSVERLQAAFRKGKTVVLILDNGDRYLFVRMSGAQQFVRVIEDKVAAKVM